MNSATWRRGAVAVTLGMGAAVVALCATEPERASAQGVASVTRISGDSGSPVAPHPAGELAATVTAKGPPRSYQVVRVVVPTSLSALSSITYDVRPLVPWNIISRTHGIIPPDTGTRSFLLTFGVPARAGAGHFSVAEVVFTAEGGTREVVLVDADVSVVHDLTLQVVQHLRGAKPGARLPLRYRVTNMGNAPDTVMVRLALPYLWGTAGPDSTRLVLESRATSEGQMTVVVPRSAGSGSYSVALSAQEHDTAAHAAESMGVEVAPLRAPPTSKGVGLATTVSTASGSSGGGTMLLGLNFDGAIYRSVNASVEAYSSPDLSDRGRYRLSSLGQFPTPPNFSLYTHDWRVRAGGVGASFSEIAGQGIGGRGVSFNYNTARLSIQTLYAGALNAKTDSTPPLMIGTRVGTQYHDMWLTGTVAHFDEGSSNLGRQLDVAALGTMLPNWYGGNLQGEVALRRYAAGDGVGLFTDYTSVGPANRMQFRAVLSPGGAAAFSNATQSFSGNVLRHVIGPWSLGTQGWYTANNEADGQAMAYGGSVTPQYALASHFSLGTELGFNGQSVQVQDSRFGTSETHLNGVFNIVQDRTSLSFLAGGARVVRGVDADSIGRSDIASNRLSVQAQLSHGTVRFGVLSVAGTVLDDESNTFGLPRQDQLTMRLDRFPLYFGRGYNLITTGVVQRLGWFGDRPSVYTMRGDITAELPLGLAVSFSVDHNPLVSIAGAGAWTTSLRVTRYTYLTIPASLRYGSRRGVVYSDLNGNGAQDPGEGGLSGVILHRGTQTTTTDDDGSFRFNNGPDATTERVLIDPRSLPDGWMQPGVPISESEAKRVRAIGIVPTSSVHVRVSVRRQDLGASPVNISAVLVAARDSLGRIWLALPADQGVFTFSALPPGPYTLEIDPSAAGAQLQLTREPPRFRVTSVHDAETIDIELNTRTIRMKTFGALKADSTARPDSLGVQQSAKKLRGTPLSALTHAAADTVPVVQARKIHPAVPPASRDSLP